MTPAPAHPHLTALCKIALSKNICKTALAKNICKTALSKNIYKTVLAALLLSGGLASAYSLTDALAEAETRPAVLAADLAAADARADLERTRADPFALRLERSSAEQRLELAEAEARAARFTALGELGRAYTAQLQAEAEAEAARGAAELSRRQVEVARIRARRGSVTALEVQEAEAALGVSAATRRAADETLALSRTSFQALLDAPGRTDALEPIPGAALAGPLPDLNTVLGAADETPTLLAARQALVTARLTGGLLDPSYSSARELAAARAAEETARAAFAEAVRVQNAGVRTLYAQTAAAGELYEAQGQSTAAAESRLTFQRRRFARGLISDLELREGELAAQTARLELLRSKHAFVTALFDLQAAAATPLWPPEGVAAQGDGRP